MSIHDIGTAHKYHGEPTGTLHAGKVENGLYAESVICAQGPMAKADGDFMDTTTAVNPGSAGPDTIRIRPECLRAYADGWVQPTPAEVRAVLAMAELTDAQAAELVGIYDGGTMRRWTGGSVPILYAAWAILCCEAGVGAIWKTAYASSVSAQAGRQANGDRMVERLLAFDEGGNARVILKERRVQPVQKRDGTAGQEAVVAYRIEGSDQSVYRKSADFFSTAEGQKFRVVGSDLHPAKASGE